MMFLQSQIQATRRTEKKKQKTRILTKEIDKERLLPCITYNIPLSSTRSTLIMMENWSLRQKFNTLSDHCESFGNPFNHPHYLDFVTKIIYPTFHISLFNQ